jgi:hypothetical protein
MTAERTAINFETRVVRRPDLLSQDIDDSTVVTDPSKGGYFGMELISHRIWHLLSKVRRVREICEVLEQEYAIDPATCAAESIAFLEDLETQGLITVLN